MGVAEGERFSVFVQDVTELPGSGLRSPVNACDVGLARSYVGRGGKTNTRRRDRTKSKDAHFSTV